MRQKLIIIGVLAALLASVADAQPSGIQEIVVTGSRMSEYDPVQTPQVTLRKRADNLITKVTVVCDTRDQSSQMGSWLQLGLH